MPELYIGLMSGTSLDGVDAADAHVAFEPVLRRELLALNSPADNEIERGALAGNALARCYAAAIAALLERSGTPASAIRAAGCHGQTVRHRPERGYTTQIGNAALLAELAGMRVIADFRSRDVAAGGQGAPLVPAFHAAVFGDAGEDRAVLNLGGIANLSWLPRAGTVSGFDTGPANCLLDLWIERSLGKTHDEGGAWASGGKPLGELLARMIEEPYFGQAPPKSTGRDLFNEAWLRAKLKGAEEPRAVQATLLELTARTVADALSARCHGIRRLIACGGGVGNRALMERLKSLIAPVRLESSAEHGIDPRLVEATAFAWLAKQALDGSPASLPSVTGARGPRVLGAIYPA